MLLALWFATASAQTPAVPWRTVRTEHFRVHYPLAAETWTLDAVSRLEAWHARVTEEVGYTPDRTIRVLVVDPWSEANGSAYPFARSPRIQLYATAPDASSIIGHYRQWSEDLLVHEDAHVVHLIRDPRNPGERLAQSLTGFGPVTVKSPRWVIEGYATVVEGRLTGFGRPNGDLRALVLRRLATEGSLPAYGELSASSRWMGGSFAYLVGSAYLEWLEVQAGPGSLRSLWARMSAKQVRTFDDAFEGVFGDPAAVLYGRFAAELTAEAIAISRDEGDAPAGKLFERIGWSVGPPAVSPDGTTVAVPTRPKDGTPALVLWSTAIDEEAALERQERIDEVLKADPADVAPVAPAHPPHERERTRRSWTTEPRDPRWMRDGEALLFGAATWDLDGRRRYDLWRWEVDRGRTERITRGADVRAPDPAPDGTWAVAVRQDWGLTQLVRVELSDGLWEALTPLAPDVVVDTPRISPDGRRLAWLENRGAGFGVVVLDLEDGTRFATSPGPGGAAALHLSWSADGAALYATLGDQGFVEVHEVWRQGGAGRGRLTSSPGGALSVDAGPAGEVFTLSMGPAGLDLHRTMLPETGLGAPSAAGNEPARRPAPFLAPPLPDPVQVEPGRYGAGPVELAPLVGGGFGSAARHGQVELGLRIGDPIGRWEVLALGGLASSDGGASGGRVGLVFRGLPVELSLDGWSVGDEALGYRRRGVAVGASRELSGPAWRARAEVDGLADASNTVATYDGIGPRVLGSAGAGVGWSEPSRGLVGASLSGQGAVGTSHGGGWTRGELGATLRVLDVWPIVAGYHYGVAAGGSGWLDGFALGGVATSLLPDVAQDWRIMDPAFAPGVVGGRRHDEVELSFGEGLVPYAVRHRFGDALGREGLSAVGLRSEVSFPEQPFIRLPAGRMEAGVACRVEFPGQGFDRRPCQEWGDYAAWASIIWGW